jgi:hypothetical protein
MTTRDRVNRTREIYNKIRGSAESRHLMEEMIDRTDETRTREINSVIRGSVESENQILRCLLEGMLDWADTEMNNETSMVEDDHSTRAEVSAEVSKFNESTSSTDDNRVEAADETSNGTDDGEVNATKGGTSMPESDSTIKTRVKEWNDLIGYHYAHSDIRNTKDNSKQITSKTRQNLRTSMSSILKKYPEMTDRSERWLTGLVSEEGLTWRQKRDLLCAVSKTLKTISEGPTSRMYGSEEKKNAILELVGSEIEAVRALEDEDSMQQDPTEKEKELWIDADKLREMIEHHSERIMGKSGSSFDELRDAGITNLYTLAHPPRRMRDYVLELQRPKGEAVSTTNWYDATTGTITINKYKKSDEYGEYKFKVPQGTKDLFARLIESTAPRKYLFHVSDEISESYFTTVTTRAFKNVIGQPLNSTLLRKIYISKEQEEGRLIYTKEREGLAKKMGHGVSMQQTVYTKRKRENEC